MSDDVIPKATPKKRGRPAVLDFSVDTLKIICDYIKGNVELYYKITRPQLFERIVVDKSLDFDADALRGKFTRHLYMFKKYHDEHTKRDEIDWPYYDLFNDLYESVLKHKRTKGATPHKNDVESLAKEPKPKTAMTDKPKAIQRREGKKRALTPPPNPFLSLKESTNGKESNSTPKAPSTKVPKSKAAPKPTDGPVGMFLDGATPDSTPTPGTEKKQSSRRIMGKISPAVKSTEISKSAEPKADVSTADVEAVKQSKAKKQNVATKAPAITKTAENVSELAKPSVINEPKVSVSSNKDSGVPTASTVTKKLKSNEKPMADNPSEPKDQPATTSSLTNKEPIPVPSAAPEVTESSAPKSNPEILSKPQKKVTQGRRPRKVTATATTAPATKDTDKPPKAQSALSTGSATSVAPVQNGKVIKKSKKKSFKSYLKKQNRQQQQITDLMKNFMELQKLTVERQAQGIQLPPNVAVMDDAVLTTIRSQQTELGSQLKKLENIISRMNDNMSK
ncbi:hypothetical protein IWQ61_008740 [Dispira simplex]|nr:hypothetical protein IWQ61_008740 [Dispira simplex]